MKNWSTHIEWQPSKVFYPRSEEEILMTVEMALNLKKRIRLIGSGHSFMPLSVTKDFLLSLDQYQGLISVNKEKKTATVKAGTKLHRLNELLLEKGLAMPNMGDINEQSIAGSISTGTHGTGTKFGNLSTQIISLTFINGLGERITCSPTQQPDLFKAAQVSLGTLGVITELTLQCVPSYQLELNIDKDDLENVMANLDSLNEEYRHFEYYWFPNTKTVMTKKMNATTDAPDKHSIGVYFQEMMLENYGFQLICETAYRFPKLTKAMSRFAASTTSHHRKINHSHKVFTTPRIVKFNEMEYNVPIEAYKDVKREIVKWIDKNNTNVMFPLENRFVQKDDIYLSPAYNRASAYIAAHVYHKKDFKPYFKALETIFLAHGGRPHWGKWNSLSQKDFAERYPQFEGFCKIRQAQDPHDTFLSDYMETVFGKRKHDTNRHKDSGTASAS